MNYSDFDVLQSNNGNGGDDATSEVLLLKNQLINSNTPTDLKNEALRSIERLERSAKRGNYSSEFENVSKYIEWITRVPWGVLSRDNFDLKHAKDLMDSTHYGMDSIKNSILDYLAAMQLKNSSNRNTFSPVQSLGSLDQRPMDMANDKFGTAKAPVFLFVGLK